MLQQPPSGYPFMGIPSLLLSIALGASQHQVTDVISGNIGPRDPRERKGVIDFENVFPFAIGLLDALKFGLSTSQVIAAKLLPMQLLLNLRGGIRSSDTKLGGPFPAISCFALHAISFGTCACLLSQIVPSSLIVGLPVLPLPLPISYAIYSLSGLNFWFAIMCFVPDLRASLALRLQPICTQSREMEMVQIGRKLLLAGRTRLERTLWQNNPRSRCYSSFGCLTTTLLAFKVQPILCRLAGMEKRRCRRFPLLASYTLLQAIDMPIDSATWMGGSIFLFTTFLAGGHNPIGIQNARMEVLSRGRQESLTPLAFFVGSLLKRMSGRVRTSASHAVLNLNTPSLFDLLTLAIGAACGSYLFLMRSPILSSIISLMLFVSLSILSPICPLLFAMSLVVSSSLLFASWSVTILFQGQLRAGSALWIQSILRTSVQVKELLSGREELSTSRTLFLLSLWKWRLWFASNMSFAIGISALSALPIQAIRRGVGSRRIEELSSSKLDLLTGAASLISVGNWWKNFFRSLLAGSTDGTPPILFAPVTGVVLRGSRKGLLTSVALLVGNVLREKSLLGYNAHTAKLHFFVVTLRGAANTAWAKQYFPLFYHKPACQANLRPISFPKNGGSMTCSSHHPLHNHEHATRPHAAHHRMIHNPTHHIRAHGAHHAHLARHDQRSCGTTHSTRHQSTHGRRH